LIALSLAALTWSLSQIGNSEPFVAARAFGPDILVLAACMLGLAGLGVYIVCSAGCVLPVPVSGGLHHQYVRVSDKGTLP
jgi:hypothetical protein